MSLGTSDNLQSPLSQDGERVIGGERKEMQWEQLAFRARHPFALPSATGLLETQMLPVEVCPITKRGMTAFANSAY